MAKQIKIADKVYDRLKELGRQEYRSMTGQLEYLLSKHEQDLAEGQAENNRLNAELEANEMKAMGFEQAADGNTHSEPLSDLVKDTMFEQSFPEPEKLRVPTAQSSLNKDYGFCKNGHAVPIGRTKCMGKGCKYA